MVKKTSPGESAPRDRWAKQIAALDGEARAKVRKEPLSTERIVGTALQIVEVEGFESLTMRRVAAVLGAGVASLYAHVRNKSDLDDLLIGELCSRIDLPEPDPARWRQQILDVCSQIRDEFLRYPGVSRAALAAAPRSLETARLNEGMLAILLGGGVSGRDAAWAIDAAYLYVSAYCLEASLRRDDHERERERSAERLRMLPDDHFPHTVAHVEDLTSGVGHERCDFTLGLLFRGLPTN